MNTGTSNTMGGSGVPFTTETRPQQLGTTSALEGTYTSPSSLTQGTTTIPASSLLQGSGGTYIPSSTSTTTYLPSTQQQQHTTYQTTTMTMPTTTTGYTPSTQSTTLHQRNPADVGGGNTNNKPYEVIDTSKAGQFTGKDYHATTVTTPPHQQTGSASTQNRPDGNNLFIIGGIASMLTACFSFGVMNVAMNARATRLFATSTAFSVAFLVLALSQFALLCYMVSWDYASLGKKRDDYLKDVIILLAFSLICAVVALGTSAREGVEYFYVMHIFAVFCNFVALAYLIGYKYSIENTKAPVYRIGRTPRWIDYVEVFLTVVLAAFVIQLTPTFNSARESSYFDAYVAFLCFLLFGVLMQVIWSFLYFFDYRGMSLLNLKRNLFATSFFNFCMVLIVFPLLGHFWDNGLETPAGIALGAFIASFLHLFWAALQVSDVYDCRCNQYNALNSGSAYQNQSSTMTKREPERSPPVTSEAGRAHLIEGGHVANV